MKAEEFREQMAGEFLNILEEKQLNWVKDWQTVNLAPRNAKSGRRYRGINRFYLSLVAMKRGYRDPRWATFAQIRERGWRLEDAKGQGVKVEYWFPYDKRERKTLTWDEYNAATDEERDRCVILAKYFTVFNASLIRGIPELPAEEPPAAAGNPDELVSTISKNMGVEIIHDGQGEAFYRIATDTIHLPEPKYFFSDYGYNSTALHELGHATGAKHRLNRLAERGSDWQSIAFEELVAEMSSCFMGAYLAEGPDPMHLENHKAYVQNWISFIREKPERLVEAVRQAEQAADYLELQAGLIPEKEYEKASRSSMEAKEGEKLPGREAAQEQKKKAAGRKKAGRQAAPRL